MKYTQTYDDEWFYPRRKKWFMRCCDCKLSHRVDFKLQKYARGFRIAMKVKRLNKIINSR